MDIQCKQILQLHTDFRFLKSTFVLGRNPVGRTGLKGRGVLGKWGPNHAADFILTRWLRNAMNGNKILDEDTKKPILQFVAIERRRGNEWAIPGVSCCKIHRILST